MADDRKSGSFYGGSGGGITAHDVDKKIENNNKDIVEVRLQQHIKISKTQPTDQKTGDIWMVIEE